MTPDLTRQAIFPFLQLRASYRRPGHIRENLQPIRVQPIGADRGHAVGGHDDQSEHEIPRGDPLGLTSPGPTTDRFGSGAERFTEATSNRGPGWGWAANIAAAAGAADVTPRKYLCIPPDFTTKAG